MITSVLVTATMFSFLILVAEQKVELMIGVILAIPVAIYNWSDFLKGEGLSYAGLIIFNVFFYGYIVVELLRYIIAHKVVNFILIATAFWVYFILGLTWSHIYFSIELLSPGALLNTSIKTEEAFSQLIEVPLSFITMTTLGYGDITPQTMIAQHWVVLQAIVGQFYLAIVIARLVALYKRQ